MIEQIIYVVLGIIGFTILNVLSTLLYNKLNINSAIIILPIFSLIVYAIYPIISIKVASIGGDINGVVAGGIIGVYNSTIGILITKKIITADDIKWKITPKGVFYGIVIAVTISIVSIYIYNQLK
ncbi:MAG: hypothetical protein KF704_02290 [Crocinitomicaceae bacterium]|nr:hypothetical protein [Cyclobacteriaceae bacterium]MBX2948081.1 hypothetical protein [Crocinitomicaceae bacterium]